MSVGPTHVAEFLKNEVAPEELEFIRRDAFELVNAFLGKIGALSEEK